MRQPSIRRCICDVTCPKSADPHAYGKAETGDPWTGRFTLTGPLPDPCPDFRATFEAKMECAVPTYFAGGEAATNGALLALADGAALLVGNEQCWKHRDDLARSFAFDGRSATWSEVGTPSADVARRPGRVPAGQSSPSPGRSYRDT